jgi:DNA-binding transcriptional LysR family regulator
VVTAVEGLLTGTLSIGIVQHFVIPKVDLLSTLGHFHAAHPGVQIRLVQNGSPILMDGVRECQLDLAVLGHVGRLPEGVTITLLARDPLLLAFPPTHPLARRKEIPLSSLGEEDFVEYQPGMTLRKLSDLAFSAAGIHRKTTCEVNSLPTALELVAQGLGIALVPQVATSYSAAVRYVRPRPPVPTWDVVIAHLGAQPTNPAARAFLKALTEKSGRTSHH